MFNSPHSSSNIKDSRLYRHYLTDTLSNSLQIQLSLKEFTNKKLILSSKDLNLTGKVISTNFDPDFFSSFQNMPERPNPIKLSPPLDVEVLLSSSYEKNHNEPVITHLTSEKKKADSAFHELPQIKFSTILSFSSPQNCLPSQIIDKKSISTQENDSIPKIKTLILTPRKAINDFSNVYKRNSIMQSGLSIASQIIPSITSCIPLIHLNSMSKANQSNKSCLISKKTMRECNGQTSMKKQIFKGFNSFSLFKAKKIKKSKSSYIQFEQGVIDKDKDQRYNFLFKDFEDEYDPNWSYDNESCFFAFQFYLTFGKSNEDKLRFGENPLNYYQNLIENTKIKEITKGDLLKIEQTLIYTQTLIANMPVFKLPVISGDTQFYSKKSRLNKGNDCTMGDKKVIRKVNCLNELDVQYAPELLFNCLVCDKTFTSAQGLGGHMSRKHKAQSENYRKRKETRDKRAPLRLINEKIKRKLCEKNNIDYLALIETRQGKKELKRFIAKHKKEYVSLKNANKKSNK